MNAATAGPWPFDFGGLRRQAELDERGGALRLRGLSASARSRHSAAIRRISPRYGSAVLKSRKSRQ